MTALKRQKENLKVMADNTSSTRYEDLSNTELQELLVMRFPLMVSTRVADENRETIVAMLKISDKK